MPSYVWQIVDAPHVASGGVRGVLTTARSRSVTTNKDDVSTAAWAMNAYTATGAKTREAQLIVPRATDLIVYRDSVCLFRGRIKTFTLDFSADASTTATMAAAGYKYLLSRRLLLESMCVRPTGGGPYTRNYVAGADAGSIVYDLITQAQTGTNRALGIGASLDGLSTLTPAAMTTTSIVVPNGGGTQTAYTGGSGNTGITRLTPLQFGVGSTFLDCITQVLTGDGSSGDSLGGEWDIIPDSSGNLKLHIWNLATGGRGANSGYVLSYPGNVISGQTGDDLDAFANGVRTSGGDSVAAIYSGGATAADGLFESQVGVTVPETVASVSSQTTSFMTSQAAQNYANLHAVRPSYTLAIRPQGWRYGDSDLGDLITVKVPSFETATSDIQRIITQAYTVGDDGGETVAVTVGNVPLFSAKAQAIRAARQNTRLNQLEKSIYAGSN